MFRRHKKFMANSKMRRAVNYAKAAVPFVTTPFISFFRRYPQPLASKSRRFYLAMAVFGAEIWKIAAGRTRVSKEGFLTAEVFGHYLRRVDNMLDQVSSPQVSQEKSAYKKDPIAKRKISAFVKSVKSLNLSVEEKKEIFRLVGEFRRNAFRAVQKFEHSQKGFQDLLELNQATTGKMGRTLVAILNVSEKIPPKERGKIEDAFENASMSMQLLDDIVDIKSDAKLGLQTLHWLYLQMPHKNMKQF